MANPTLTPGITFFGPPPLLGELYFISGPNVVTRAIASTLPPSRVVGVYPDILGSLMTGEGVSAKVFFVPGLTLFAGDVVYLSASVAGAATNVAPSGTGLYVATQGIVLDPSTYNPSGGGVASVILQRGSIYGAVP